MARTSAAPTDLRAALRVRPGTRVDLAKVDPAETYGRDEGRRGRGARDGARAADRSPGPPLGRGQAQGPRRPPGDRRGRQGRHAPPRHGRVQPAGLSRHRVQGAVGRGARPRLPVARPPARPRQGRDRRLQPLPLRGRPRRSRPRHRPEGRLVAPLRPDQRVRASCSPRKARRSSSSSSTSTSDEQRERFQARLDDPTKRWKFRLGDLEERKHWDDYIAAYEDALSRCSTDKAPWYVIPSNKKWFRNLAVTDILADTLDDLKPRYPEPTEDLTGVIVE